MTSFSVRVAANGDDGIGATTYAIAGQTFGHVGANVYSAFFRFLSVTIPNAAIIDTAKITWQALDNSAGTATINIKGEAADSAAQITSAADFNGRSRTSAVAYAPTGWTTGNNYDSVDISAIIQAIVNRAGWASGNNLQIFCDDAGSGTNYVDFKDYSTSSSVCALLTVTYHVAATFTPSVMIF